MKRSIEEEQRIFQKRWELQYFCIQGRTKVLCLICEKTIAVPKEYNIRRHYETNHQETYKKYVSNLREDKLLDLMAKHQKQQGVFIKHKDDNEAAVRTSYLLSYLIAGHSKPFTEGEFIRECILKAVTELCPDQLHRFKNISLSRNTIAGRIDDIAENVRVQLKSIIQTFETFSIAIDDTTDVQDTAHLAVFIRGCDVNLTVTEELLEIIPMHGTTTGNDIFNSLMTLLMEYNVPLKKLACLATDGAPAMTGKIRGLVTKLKEVCQQQDNNNFIHLHCIIHQETLCCKVLKIGHVLRNVSKIVNFIRARALNHRQFMKFLEEIESEYSDIPYYTEIRWLSSHKVLKRFFELLKEITTFLECKNYECGILKDDQWIKDLAFAVDITNHLSQLNLKLQGKNYFVPMLFDHITTFKQKLVIWHKQLIKENLYNFECCRNLLQKSPDLKFSEYADQIKLLEDEFDRRFLDFKKCEHEFSLFTSPLSIDVEMVNDNLQMEIIELQNDSILKQKYTEVGIPIFYKYLKSDQFPYMLSVIRRILAMFGSTYLCEQLFSILKNNKTPERSRLTDQHLQSILKVTAAQEIQPNFDVLVNKKRCIVSSKK